MTIAEYVAIGIAIIPTITVLKHISILTQPEVIVYLAPTTGVTQQISIFFENIGRGLAEDIETNITPDNKSIEESYRKDTRIRNANKPKTLAPQQKTEIPLPITTHYKPHEYEREEDTEGKESTDEKRARDFMLEPITVKIKYRNNIRLLSRKITIPITHTRTFVLDLKQFGKLQVHYTPKLRGIEKNIEELTRELKSIHTTIRSHNKRQSNC